MENSETIVNVDLDKAEKEYESQQQETPKAKRVRLSKGAKHAAAVYDKYSKKTVKELRSELKDKGRSVPLSRLSKAMLIAMLEEQVREKKTKVKKSDKETQTEK
jgi:hypothetical protein